MPIRVAPAVLLAACALTAPSLGAQQFGLDRLPATVLEVSPPSTRVRGEPGRMGIESAPCRTRPMTDIRRRIVDVAVQEWGFFGFRVVDRRDLVPPPGPAGTPGRGGPRRRWLGADEAGRVATTIAGYWAVTPEGSWIIGRQNQEWAGPDGIGARWNAPWSAAFISWVMCEAGLGGVGQFQRAVAHHAYIDQAIRARVRGRDTGDSGAAPAAYEAYDVGESAIAPGDLLCSSRRPLYRSVADRRRQMGVGARTHCDIVVKLDERGARILAIGGNVRGVVSLKLLPAERVPGKSLRVVDPEEGARPVFIHMKLRAQPIEADALAASATVKAAMVLPVFRDRLAPLD
jgi:hypothetical protein